MGLSKARLVTLLREDEDAFILVRGKVMVTQPSSVKGCCTLTEDDLLDVRGHVVSI